MAETNQRSGQEPRQPRQYVTDADRSRFTTEAVEECKNIKSVEEAEKRLKKITNPAPASLGLRWLFDKLGGFVNMVKVVVFSVFLGRRETSRRINAGTMTAEKNQQLADAKRDIRVQVLKAKIQEAEEQAIINKTPVTITQFGLQLQHMSEQYRTGLTAFIAEQLGIDAFKIMIHNDMDEKGRGVIAVDFPLTTGKFMSVQVNENGQWMIPNAEKPSRDLQALAGEIRKGVIYYTKSDYDMTKDPEYNRICRELTRPDGTVFKDSLTPDRIPSGIAVSPKRVEEILNNLFEKGGQTKNRDFSALFTYSRKGDTITVEFGKTSNSPYIVTRENIKEMADKISKQSERYIGIVTQKFAVRGNTLKEYLAIINQTAEKELLADMSKALSQNLDQAFENARNISPAIEVPEPAKVAPTVPDIPEVPIVKQDPDIPEISEIESGSDYDAYLGEDHGGMISELNDDGSLPYDPDREAREAEAEEICSRSTSYSLEPPTIPDPSRNDKMDEPDLGE